MTVPLGLLKDYADTCVTELAHMAQRSQLLVTHVDGCHDRGDKDDIYDG